VKPVVGFTLPSTGMADGARAWSYFGEATEPEGKGSIVRSIEDMA